MKVLRTTLQRADQSYWAERTDEQMLAISAWIALKEGARDQALQFMRVAADSEDGSLKHVAMENRLYPFRELLGELLLEMGAASSCLERIRDGAQANAQSLPSVLGSRPCCRQRRRSPEGI